MVREDIYKRLLIKYCKQIVHLRQQYTLPSPTLGMVLGAGISLDIGLPNWKDLVQRISQIESIKNLDVKITSESDPILNAQLLYQTYKASRAILSQKDTDATKLGRQQQLIQFIYSQASQGVTIIDTKNKSKAQVAKEIARKIFIDDYCKAPLEEVFNKILEGKIIEPDDICCYRDEN